MAISRHARWRAQVLLMLAITVLAVTGLINWLLPAGPTLRSLRHLMRWIHEGAALGFVTFLGVHLYFQWATIRRNLRLFGLWGPGTASPAARSDASKQ
jgi:cytochrome b subunit of formate dehydrogenase